MMAANGRYISTPDDQPRRPNDNTYWVVNDKFIAGEYPTDRSVREEASMEKLRKYLDLGINYFVDLTQNGEKQPYEEMLKKIAKEKEAKVSYQRLPVQDFSIPTKQEMKQILDTIDGAIADGKTVYVHCRGGIGRTGTTVGCFLARNGNYNGQEALDETNRLFQFSGRSYESAYSPETRDQMSFVSEWKEDIHSS